MLLACGSCGVRYAMREQVPAFLCAYCRRRPSEVVAAKEAIWQPSPYLRAAKARGREREEQQEFDRRWAPWWFIAVGEAIAWAAALARRPLGWSAEDVIVGAVLTYVIFVVYLLVLRRLAAAMTNDYAPLGRSFVLTLVLLAMQVSSVLLARGGGWLAPMTAGLFVFGVLARYFLRVAMARAIAFTLTSAIVVSLLTVVLVGVVLEVRH